jgi:hypothetical protein
MTGFPDDHLNGSPREFGGPGDAGADPLEPLLRHPAPFLAAPPGAFQRIRRKAARRRRVRTALGGSAAVAVIAGALYVAGSLHTGDGRMVGPPASSLRGGSPSATPTTSAATPPATAPGATGSPQPRPNLTTTPTPTPTSISNGPPGALGSPVPTAAPTTTAPTPTCAAGQLNASLGGGNAGAGNLYRYLLLTNTGTTTCHLAGFPGLSLLDASGRPIGAPATREQPGYSEVVLQPGGSASDTIHTANHQGTCLPTSTQLRVYPPGSRASLVFPGQITNCGNLFGITPLTSGTTGNPPA